MVLMTTNAGLLERGERIIAVGRNWQELLTPPW
jgi:hypothetical protein